MKRLALLFFAVVMLASPANAEPTALQTRLETLSSNGSGEAAYHLGMVYHMGLEGTAKDPKKAFELFKLSAERGDPFGAYKYGCYFDGQGQGIVESDAKTALRWKLIAAEAGYSLAQEDVAKHLFAEGDEAGALKWLESAASQGSSMALGFLGGLYAGIIPPDMPAPKVVKDEAKGWAYLLLSVQEIPEIKSGFEAELSKLTPEVQARAKALAAAWKRKPSALDDSEGISAAYKLVGLPVPKK
jgi:uncharacterized protein